MHSLNCLHVTRWAAPCLWFIPRLSELLKVHLCPSTHALSRRQVRINYLANIKRRTCTIIIAHVIQTSWRLIKSNFVFSYAKNTWHFFLFGVNKTKAPWTRPVGCFIKSRAFIARSVNHCSTKNSIDNEISERSLEVVFHQGKYECVHVCVCVFVCGTHGCRAEPFQPVGWYSFDPDYCQPFIANIDKYSLHKMSDLISFERLTNRDSVPIFFHSERAPVSFELLRNPCWKLVRALYI